MISYIKNADCFDEFKNIKKKSIDLILVDLPYGQTAHVWDVKIDLIKMWKELKKICKDSCIYIFFCTTKYGNEIINSNPLWFRYDLVWEKYNSVGFLSANKAPLRIHEMIYIFSFCGDDLNIERNLYLREYAKKIKKYINKSIRQIEKETEAKVCHFYTNGTQFSLPTLKSYNILIDKYKINKMNGFLEYKELEKKNKKPTYNPQKTTGHKPYKGRDEKTATPYGFINKSKKNNNGERFPTSILKYGNDKQKYHGTQKPVAILEWLIKTYSNEGDLVVDFTMGSGSTIEACINTNRRYIGIEKNKDIFKIAKGRIDAILKNDKNVLIV